MEIEKQKAASEAANLHLQVLDESEIIRDKLTPEFMLLKLQAQEFLANSQIAEIRAITDYNIALAELSRITGTTLELHLLEPVTSVEPENNSEIIIEPESNIENNIVPDTNTPDTYNSDELVPVEMN